jgi:hypothetical protein
LLRALQALAHSKIRFAFALQAALADLRRWVSTGLTLRSSLGCSGERAFEMR